MGRINEQATLSPQVEEPLDRDLSRLVLEALTDELFAHRVLKTIKSLEEARERFRRVVRCVGPERRR